MTPASATSSYCTNAQFVQFYDVRTIGDWISDDGTRVTPAILTDITTAPGTLLAALLQKASGMIEAACLIGGRYSASDLANLTSAADRTLGLTSNTELLLQGLVADLAVWIMWSRRPNRDAQMPLQSQLALGTLEELRNGTRIFGTQEAINAGLPEDPVETPPDVIHRNGATYQMNRYFGVRGNLRIPPNTGGPW